MKKSKEPEAIRELHRIRQEMQAEAKRVGSTKYWAEANEEGKAFARRHRLKYVETPPTTARVREKPTKKYKA